MSDEERFWNARRVLVFLAIFGTLSLIMNYYIFAHLSFLLGIPRNGWFWAFLVLSSFSWFLVMGLEMQFPNGTVRVFYIIVTVWLGLLFMFLVTLVVYDIVRFFVPLDTALVAPTVVAVSVASVAYGIINARFLRVREEHISTDKVDGEVRIVHLSDLHIGSMYGPRYLQKIVKMANALLPDMVLITGDLADGPHRYTEKYFQPLNDLLAPVYFTTGNHELFAGLEHILGLLGRTKVRHLKDEVVMEKDLQIVGVDYDLEPNAVARVLDSVDLDPDRFTVLMYHVPREFEAVKARGVDLMLSGHTHGGQSIPFTFLARAVWKRFRGMYDLGGTRLFVTTGTGTWGPPIRVGTRSEIALLRINGNGTSTA